ncbi:MAG: hypothetical protein I8H88_15830 [Burkholderiales bacterium]|nr:hypothetical protein [Burkholderiales bacterium]
MNTAHLIPEACVAAIILRSDEHPDLPFFGGTGFFVHFPPYDRVYFVTARHCVCSQSGTLKGKVEVKLNNDPNCNLAVPFSEKLTVLESDDSPDYEDIVVFTVGPLEEAERLKLLGRSLRLLEQNIADFILATLVSARGKVRTVGYPGASKAIDYENNHATVQPRGIVGTVTAQSDDEKWYTVEELNWKDGEISGFSGSPILEFVPGADGKLAVRPIGVLLTGAKNEVFKFVKINLVTNLISGWILKSGISAAARIDT